jgi:hypothetical protein
MIEKENSQVGFALKGIKIEQFAIFEESYAPKKETNLGTDTQTKVVLHKEKDKIIENQNNQSGKS